MSRITKPEVTRSAQAVRSSCKIRVFTFRSPLGSLIINSKNGKITHIHMGFEENDSSQSIPPVLKRCKKELDEYFRGHRETFTVPVDLSGLTAFQKKVLEVLREVPFGATVSYGEIAEQAGVPGGGRAVGNVMNMNPVPIIVPCHRVIRADGTQGGFGMGKDVKRLLLLFEKNPKNREQLPWSNPLIS